MIRLNHILVPIDFSDLGSHALVYGCELARRFQAQLHLLHVVEEVFPFVPESGMVLHASGAIVTATEYVDVVRKSAEERLATLPDATAGSGLTVHRTITIGAPVVEIIGYAREREIDLIVIGTHGRTGLSHLLIGSVAENVVRKAPCPVLSIRPEGHDFVMP